MIDPNEIRNVFKKSGQLKKVQRILGKNDYGVSVMHILNLMKENNVLPDIERETKCKYKSHFLRDQGNDHFKNSDFDKALQHYNLALMFAPKDSKAMKLSLGNRSALFFRLKRYKACEKDIETVLKLGCPSEIKPKLLSRLEACRSAKSVVPDVSEQISEKVQNLFKVKDSPNEHIPCATSAVDLIMKESNRVVIANIPIQPGEVVAVETPYVSHISKENQSFCCHRCHNFAENLMPCDTCCVNLYCSTSCRNQSWAEGHKIECEMMSAGAILPNIFRLSLKAVLKSRSECSSWDELMTRVNSANTSNDDLKKGFVSDKLDSKHYESVCTQAPFKNTSTPEHMFDMIVITAIALHALSIISMKDINGEKKEEIMKFVGKQLIYHTVDGIAKHISASISERYGMELDSKLTLPNKGIGYFGFVGLLPHSCNPNVECFGVNNKIVLVATKSIPAGTELVTCYGLTYLEGAKQDRAKVLLKHFRLHCQCEACEKNWRTELFPTYDITKEQDEYIINFCLGRAFEIDTLEKAVEKFSTLCTGLSTLQNRPKSQYMFSLYKAFKMCLSFFQYHLSPHYLKGDILSIEQTLKMLTFSKAQ